MLLPMWRMPEPGQQDYGYTYTSDKTAIMEGTLTDLFMGIDNSTFDTYPWGFLKTVVPDKDDLKKLTDILERCTGCSMDELADLEYEWVQNAGGETDQGFTIPLADDLDYDTFLAEVAKVCDIVGKGSSYERSAFETTTRIPMTYDQAMTSYNEICDIDHVTDSYMRLFCDYASIMLGLLPIFVMVLIPVLILAFAMELPYISGAHTGRSSTLPVFPEVHRYRADSDHSLDHGSLLSAGRADKWRDRSYRACSICVLK